MLDTTRPPLLPTQITPTASAVLVFAQLLMSRAGGWIEDLVSRIEYQTGHNRYRTVRLFNADSY